MGRKGGESAFKRKAGAVLGARGQLRGKNTRENYLDLKEYMEKDKVNLIEYRTRGKGEACVSKKKCQRC